jgi:simple sugar transport system permease protein
MLAHAQDLPNPHPRTGILLLYLVQNVLTLGDVPAQWIGALNGALILIALVLSRITGGKVQE